MTTHIPIKVLDEIKRFDTDEDGAKIFRVWIKPAPDIEWHDRRGINTPFLVTIINKEK